MFRRLMGSSHNDATDSAWVQPYALADGSYAYQARCSCGWYTDLFINEHEFVRTLRQHHADTGN